MQNTNSLVSIDDLLKKEHKFISSDEALHDVIPPSWDGAKFIADVVRKDSSTTSARHS